MFRKTFYLSLFIVWLIISTTALAVPHRSGVMEERQEIQQPSQGGILGVLDRARIEQERKLVGSYRATFISGDNPPAFPMLPALITFNSDGTLIETDGGALVPTPPPNPQFGSPGHGVWRRIGDHLYEMKFVVLIVNQDGTLSATGNIKLTIQLERNGRQFEGEGTFSFLDPDGNPLPGGSGAEKIQGRRIEFD